MDKANFMGSLYLIDDWTSFDNERFDVIRNNSDGLEEVTTAELALMANVKAVMLDENWFQVYDNNNKFTEKYVASGLYWNYFYHTWKTISSSPFANAVVFVTDSATVTLPQQFTVEVTDKTTSDIATTLTLTADRTDASLQPFNVQFVQTEALTKDGIAVHPYGAMLIPASAVAKDITVVATINGESYTGATTLNGSSEVGATVNMVKG